MTRSLRHGLLVGAALLLAASGVAHASDYTVRAQALLAKGETRAAAIELRNAVKQDPADATAHYQLAKLDLLLGEAVAAEREAHAAKDHGYAPGEALSLLLDTYLAQARYKDLLRDFPAGQGNPDLAARIAIGRGRAELGLDQPDRAAADFATALRLAPHSIEPLLAEEDLEAAQHQVAAAQKTIEAALAIDPHSQPALLRKATLLLATGDAKGAVALLAPALAAAPGDPGVRLAMASALISAGENAKAATEVNKVLAMVPESVQATYLQALLLARAGHYDQVSPLLQKLSPVMARVPEAYLLQAVTMEHLGRWAEAGDAAQHFLGRFPGDARGERLLAEVALHAGQPQAALAALQTLPAATRDDAGTLDLFGRAHAATGDLAAAESEFAMAAKLAPQLADPHAALADVKLRLGDTGAAISEYQKALALAPTDAETRRRLIAAAIQAGQFDLAAANLVILQKQEGDTAPNALLRGQLQLVELDIAGAHDTYSAILKAHPDSVAAALGLARVAAFQGDVTEEKRRLIAVLAKDPTNRSALAALTAVLAREGNLGGARAALERAHGAAPNDDAVTANLAALDIRMKEPSKALDLLATTNVSTNPLLLTLQAEAELALNKNAAAENTLRTLLGRVPGAAEPRLTLARLLVLDKDFAGARTTLNDGLAHDPRNLALLQGLVGITLAEHGPKAALAEAKTIAADPSHLPEARALEGDFYISQHQPAVAADAYAAALAAAPSAALVVRLGQALQVAGKPAEAADRLRSYLAQHPDAIPVALVLGGIEIQEGQLDSAAKQLASVVAAQPNNVAALNNLAWIRATQGKPDALQLAERAYFLSGDPHVADTLGWILTRQKPSRTGVVLLQQAHAASPDDPTVTYHLAEALAADGQNKAAAALLGPIVAGAAAFADKPAASALLQKIGGHP